MSYLNKTKIKQYILDRAQKTRAHKFERVSSEVYDHLDGIIRSEVDRLIRLQPSMGKTIYPVVRMGQ